MNTLLKFEITARWNCKLITANCSLRFAFSHEKPNAKCLYDDVCKRQTLIYTTWPSFSFACRPLFIISAHKFSSFMQFFIHKNFLSCFSLLIFYFEMNSQLEPDVCRLAYTWSLNSLKIGDENVKKSNRFNTQNSCNFARASRFFVHFVAVFARLRPENA